MPKYSKKSLERLSESHPDLRIIFKKVLRAFDHSIICGYRNKQDQQTAYHSGRSKLEYPKSKHNKRPYAMAIDAVPYPIDWRQTKRMRYFAGFVVATANILYDLGLITHRIRWGGDWDMDTETNDQRFDDLPHFELIKNENNL